MGTCINAGLRGISFVECKSGLLSYLWAVLQFDVESADWGWLISDYV